MDNKKRKLVIEDLRCLGFEHTQFKIVRAINLTAYVVGSYLTEKEAENILGTDIELVIK